MVAKNTSHCQVQEIEVLLTSLSMGALLKQKLLKAAQELDILPKDTEFKQLPLYRLKNTTKIVYRCSLPLKLAGELSLSPQQIAANLLAQLMVADSLALPSRANIQARLALKLSNRGWIDCYLSDLSVSIWLEQFPKLFFPVSSPHLSASHRLNLFPIQYTHARCCALLRLGVDSGLIKFPIQDFHLLGWSWIAPTPIPWLKYSEQGKSLFALHSSEYSLISQIIAVIDDLETISPAHLPQLVRRLCYYFWEFEKYCQILREIQENSLELSQARLGLVAITKTLLCYFLQTGFQVVPMSEL